ncbi:MAG: restriction endonuclease [Dehalococcoidia bacterium]|nr:restriction endonuclease [Dehalococcoidia bacterium]
MIDKIGLDFVPAVLGSDRAVKGVTSIVVVPKRRELRRPILEIIVGEEHAVSPRQIRDSLIERLSLTENVLQEKIPSGQPRFVSEANRAISTLKIAGLLYQPSSGLYRATSLGRGFLATHEGDIWSRHLTEAKRQSSTFDHEEVKSLTNSETEPYIQDVRDVSPGYVSGSEQMRYLNHKMNDELADELLDGIKDISSDSFERLVVRLLERMGYGEGEVVGGSGDEGIDGIINQDPLGLEKVYIQAKRWQNQVGEPEIRNFSGSLEAKGANKGVFITTSTFSSTARQTAQFISAGSKFIRLIDGYELASLMIEHGVGVITETTYELKKIDENYFVDL